MDIPARANEIIESALSQKQVELVDMEYKREGSRLVLRILVDKPQGITLDECTDINKLLGDVFDKEDAIPSSYTLEVASPGLDRKLKKMKDFRREIGKQVRVHTYEAIDGKKTHVGKLMGTGEDTIVVEDAEGISREIPAGKISKAKLEAVL
jgi:ribosome maturation factor RimP